MHNMRRKQRLCPVCDDINGSDLKLISGSLRGFNQYRILSTSLLTPLFIFAENGSPVDILRKVTLPILDDQACLNAFRSTFYKPTNICAGVMEGGRDACGVRGLVNQTKMSSQIDI